MADAKQDRRPFLERGTSVLWLAGISAAIAVVLHFVMDLSNPVTALLHVLVLSLITWVLFWRDKRRSEKEGARRIPERVLLGVGLLGGATGGVLGMSMLRHKTKNWIFKILLPLMALVHVAVLLWLSGWFD